MLQARRIKKNYRGGYQLMENVGHYGCLIKKYCQLKLSTMARNTFNIRRGRWCKFPLWIHSTINRFLRNCLRLTFSSLRDSQFRCGFLIFQWWKLTFISSNFKVDFLIEIFMRFSLKSSWIQILMPFLFLTVRSLLFQNSSDPDVTPNITYLLHLFEIGNCNTKENL